MLTTKLMYYILLQGKVYQQATSSVINYENKLKLITISNIYSDRMLLNTQDINCINRENQTVKSPKSARTHVNQ